MKPSPTPAVGRPTLRTPKFSPASPSSVIAASFRQGRRIPLQVEAVLAALVWDGWLNQAEDNAGFVLREAA